MIYIYIGNAEMRRGRINKDREKAMLKEFLQLNLYASVHIALPKCVALTSKPSVYMSSESLELPQPIIRILLVVGTWSRITSRNTSYP